MSKNPYPGVDWLEHEKFGNGRYASVSLNNKGQVVVMHQGTRLVGIPNLHYIVGQVKGRRIEWGKDYEREDGSFVSVSVNDRGQVVEVHQGNNGGFELWCRVGQLQDFKIDWASGHKIETEHGGKRPSVCLTNDGDVLLVYESYLHRNLYSCLGRLRDAEVDWAGHRHYDDGMRPSASMNGKGHIVEAHDTSSRVSYAQWYRVGNRDGKKVEWGHGHEFDVGLGIEVSVAGSNVIQVHSGEMSSKLWYRTGHLVEEKHQVLWGHGHHYADGMDADVCANKDDAIVTVYNTPSHSGTELIYMLGRFVDG